MPAPVSINDPACEPYKAPRPRLSIGFLLMLMLILSVSLAVSRLMWRNAAMRNASLGAFDFILVWTILELVKYQVVACSVPATLWLLLHRRKNPSFAFLPGHWICFLATIAFFTGTMCMLTNLALSSVLIDPESENMVTQRLYALVGVVPLAITGNVVRCSVAVFAFRRERFSQPWRNYFLGSAVRGVAALSCLGAAFLNYIAAFPGMLVLTAAVTEDLRKSQSSDWIHWLGIGTAVVRYLLEIAFLVAWLWLA